MADTSLSLEEALALLAEHASAADTRPAWPAASWDALRRAGVLGWAIPRAYGGEERSPLDLLEGYGRLAGACLTTCFLLSQRDAACRRLRDSGNEALCRELFPALARGARFATVGLAQLTTSRQHVRPVLTARRAGDAFRLDGVMPWVTGAPHADHFLTGAVLDDGLQDRRDKPGGSQVLLVVPRDTPGLTVGPPLDLMALQGSLTGAVRCDNAVVEGKWVLAGPAERVMPPGRGAGNLETSALALGLARSAVAYLEAEAHKRPELRGSADACAGSWQVLHDRLRDLAGPDGTPEAAARLRAQANALVLRGTQLALAAAKGTGFVHPHPTQRWARQALFFLVWSCPRPALEGTLAHLQPPPVD